MPGKACIMVLLSIDNVILFKAGVIRQIYVTAALSTVIDLVSCSPKLTHWTSYNWSTKDQSLPIPGDFAGCARFAYESSN
jgi:hypothetical protein